MWEKPFAANPLLIGLPLLRVADMTDEKPILGNTIHKVYRRVIKWNWER